MSRPLPPDLIPIVDSRGPSVANPGLRLLRWVDWGDDFALPEADETTFLKHSVNLFKKQAKPDSVLSHALAARNARSNRIVGTADRAVEQLETLQERTGADELMISTVCHGTRSRIASLELLADAWSAVPGA